MHQLTLRPLRRAGSRTTMWNDFTGRAVLVTGGTRGIGLATGLAFGSRGAHVTLTHKWGSTDEAAIVDAFAEGRRSGASIVQADAANDDDVLAVLEGIRRDHDRLEVLVSNAAFGATVSSVDDYSKKALHAGIDYSAWPLVAHTLAPRTLFGKAPRYVVGRVVRRRRHHARRLRLDRHREVGARNVVPLPALPA